MLGAHCSSKFQAGCDSKDCYPCLMNQFHLYGYSGPTRFSNVLRESLPSSDPPPDRRPPYCDFFKPRLAHHKPEYNLWIPKTPGSPVADWRNLKPTRVTKLRRSLLPHWRQNRPSPSGLSKLPYELLEPIFNDLCGHEILAARLVCTEWEKASRLFVTEVLEKRSTARPYWPVAASLKRSRATSRS